MRRLLTAARDRGSRRGLSLWEITLTLAVAGLLINGAASSARRIAGDLVDQAEGRVVSAAADAALAFSSSDPADQIAAARTGGITARIVARAELTAAGALPGGFPQLTAAGRALRWAVWAPDASTLFAAAWAAGDPRGGGTAMPGPGIDRVGRVGGAGQAACGAGRLCGAGVARDISGLLAALGPQAPDPGDMLALRGLSLLTRDPGHLRSEGGGGAGLNRMDTTLTITGDLLNVGAMSAAAAPARISVRVAARGAAAMDLADFSGGLDIDGDLIVTGDLDVVQGISGFGAVTAAGTAAFSRIESGQAELAVLGGAAFGALSVGAAVDRAAGFEDLGLIDAQTISVPSVSVDKLIAAELNSGAMTADVIELGDLAMDGSLTLDTLTAAGELHLGTCTGC